MNKTTAARTRELAPDARRCRCHLFVGRAPWQAATFAVAILVFVITGCTGGAADSVDGVPAPATGSDAPAGVPTPKRKPAGIGAAAVEDPRITALQAAVERRPQDQEAHHALAVALNESEQRQASIPHFEQAVALDASVRNVFDLAVAYSGASHFPQSEAMYRRLLVLSPENPQTLHNLGNVLLNMGKKDAAIDMLWRAIRAQPQLLRARYDLASIYKFYGQHQEAYSMYQSVLQATPRDDRDQQTRAESLYQIASIDVARGAHAEAEQALAQLLRMMPEHPSAHYTRGQALLHLGRLDEAQREFDTHVQILARAPSTSPMATGR